MDYRDKFFDLYDPQGFTLKDWLTGTPAQMEAQVAPLWSIPLRATFPRLSATQRAKMSGNLTAGERQLLMLYDDLLQDLPQAAPGAGLPQTVFRDILEQDIEAGRMVEIAGTLAQAAQRGIVLLDSTVAGMNTTVMVAVNDRLGDPDRPQKEHDLLEGTFAEAFRGDAEDLRKVKARAQRQGRGQAALKKQLGAVQNNLAVRRALALITGKALPGQNNDQ